MRSGLELSESADLLIIYDLPLNSGLLAPVFNIKQPETVLPVYLFYNEEDYRHNIHLLALALPLAEELTAIFTAHAAAAEDKEEKKLAFPDATVLKNLNWHKGPTFWERVEKIFAETGLLREGCLDKDPDQPEKDLSVLLQSAPTYRSVRETWEDCEKFQQNLINGSLEEIASHLN